MNTCTAWLGEHMCALGHDHQGPHWSPRVAYWSAQPIPCMHRHGKYLCMRHNEHEAPAEEYHWHPSIGEWDDEGAEINPAPTEPYTVYLVTEFTHADRGRAIAEMRSARQVMMSEHASGNRHDVHVAHTPLHPKDSTTHSHTEYQSVDNVMQAINSRAHSRKRQIDSLTHEERTSLPVHQKTPNTHGPSPHRGLDSLSFEERAVLQKAPTAPTYINSTDPQDRLT